jgi:hypothetical protein
MFNEKLKLPIGVDWGKLKQAQIEPIFDAWQKMGDDDRRRVEVVLQDVNAMACEEGVKVLLRDGATWGKNLEQELNQWPSRYDKAMWTYLKHHDVWALASQFAWADRLEGTRYWVKRTNVPKTKAKTDDVTKKSLEDALAAYYTNAEGRGHICRAQTLKRNSEQDYFFVNLSDYADSYDKLDPKKRDFVREFEQRAFTVVFVYEEAAGTLELCAHGPKRFREGLLTIFSRIVLEAELPDEDGKQPYQLRQLLAPTFNFAVESGDGLDHVRVRRMRLTPLGNHKRRIALEANPEGNANDVYEMLDRYVNKDALPATNLNVDQVTLTFRFKNGSAGRSRSFSFNLSSPNGSNLKSLREEYRVIGEKYLKKWGIEVG